MSSQAFYDATCKTANALNTFLRKLEIQPMASKKASKLADTDWYKTLLNYFNQHKVNGEQILTSVGLPSLADCNETRRYYSDAVAAAFRELARLTRNPASGLHSYHALSHLGVLSHLMQAASNVELALTQAARYLHLYWPMANIEMPSAPERCVIRLSLSSGQNDIPGELYDFFIIGVINALRMITAVQPQIVQISRPGASPVDQAPWQQTFGCNVIFNSSECSITLDRTYLKQGVPTANSAIFDFCNKLLEQIAEQRGFSIKAQIRAILPAHLARGKVRRDTIAAQLDISERTLCRRIASEGTTFSNLVDDLRRDLAQSYIRQGYSPTETAYSIGFSDPSNFYRACRRWFGTPPAHLTADAGSWTL